MYWNMIQEVIKETAERLTLTWDVLKLGAADVCAVDARLTLTWDVLK